MKDEIDHAIQILAVTFVIAFISTLYVKAYPILNTIYFYTAIVSLIFLFIHAVLQIAPTKIARLSKQLSQPTLVVALATFLIGMTILFLQTPEITPSQQVPVEEVGSLQIQLLPHVATLLIIFTSVLLSSAVKNRYRNKFISELRKVIG